MKKPIEKLPRDFKELISTEEYEPWAKELLSKFFVYKFGEKLPDQVGAHEKDKVENFLHKEVCAQKISLFTAQGLIVDDWYNIYLRNIAK